MKMWCLRTQRPSASDKSARWPTQRWRSNKTEPVYPRLEMTMTLLTIASRSFALPRKRSRRSFLPSLSRPSCEPCNSKVTSATQLSRSRSTLASDCRRLRHKSLRKRPSRTSSRKESYFLPAYPSQKMSMIVAC